MGSFYSMLVAILLVSGCLATLPAPVLISDTKIFEDDPNVYAEAQACGGHLTNLRSNAKWSSLSRLLLTVASGTTTAVSGYVAATESDDDPDKAKTAAQIALVSGVIGVLTQAIPEPSDALAKHRDASSSWVEARRRVYNGTKPNDVQFLLQACRNNQPFIPVPQGATQPLVAPPPAPVRPGATEPPVGPPPAPVRPGATEPSAGPPPAPVRSSTPQ